MSPTRPCPSCGATLVQAQTPHGIHFACPECEGIQIGVGVLRKLRDAEAVQQLWVQARRGNRAGARDCAECKAGMLIVETPPEHGGIEIDTCPRCYLVWLDPGELDKLPAKPRMQAELEQHEQKKKDKRAHEESRSRALEVERMPSPYAQAGVPELAIIEMIVNAIFWRR